MYFKKKKVSKQILISVALLYGDECTAKDCPTLKAQF